MAHAVAATALFEQVGGIGHAFHAAGDHHIAAAGHQLVMGQDGGLHAGAAHLRQGHSASTLGQTTLEQRLARRGLALASHQAVAEQHLFHFFRGDTRALHRCLDGRAAQVIGRELGKIAHEGTHGGTGCANDNDGIMHLVSPD